MAFIMSNAHMIPVEPGHAVEPGWTAATGFKPLGVTWHWTATWDLQRCTDLLGGRDPVRKGMASAHYGVGRSFAEGVHRYVALKNRSWHAGKNNLLRWHGQRHDGDETFKGNRTCIGVEVVNIGFAREDVPRGTRWLTGATPDGQEMRVQPWSEEQITMLIAVGREILARWPHIEPRHHMGHHDLCPIYKVDPITFPFARVLRGIYFDPSIPDVWTPLWTLAQRRRALIALGYPVGEGNLHRPWDDPSQDALRQLQGDHGLAVNGFWTTFVNWRVFDLLNAKGLSLTEVTRALPNAGKTKKM